jgi:hypothetical protein
MTMTTAYNFKITDKNDANAHSFNVTRWDFNENRGLKYYPFVSRLTQPTITTGTIFDFGRKVEGFVIYGVIKGGYDEVVAIRTLINEKWWELRPAKLYITDASSHSGQVADFKAYCDAGQGADTNIKFTLTFTVGMENPEIGRAHV